MVYKNDLSSAIPAIFVNLTSLTSLYLSWEMGLNGGIPMSVDYLSSLQHLWLNNKKFDRYHSNDDWVSSERDG